MPFLTSKLGISIIGGSTLLASGAGAGLFFHLKNLKINQESETIWRYHFQKDNESEIKCGHLKNKVVRIENCDLSKNPFKLLDKVPESKEYPFLWIEMKDNQSYRNYQKISRDWLVHFPKEQGLLAKLGKDKENINLEGICLWSMTEYPIQEKWTGIKCTFDNKVIS